MASQPGPLPVVESANRVVAACGEHVTISPQALDQAAVQLLPDAGSIQQLAGQWDEKLHFTDGGPLTVQYLLVVDALNFCFWPDGEFEYEHLAGGIKASLLEDRHALDADRLARIDGAGVRRLLRWKRDMPQQEERARLLREVGSVLQQQYNGRAASLVEAANGSAVALVQLVAAQLPGFRDHSIYNGEQAFFYKRAQIFVADVYGAFGGQGLGAFHDIGQLTMFADYRVPVVLRLKGILQYSDALAARVDSQQELPAGSPEEVAIRAASIVAVEELRQRVNQQIDAGGEQQQQRQLYSIHLDWWLWGEGEKQRDTHPPHHRTRTIYY